MMPPTLRVSMTSPTLGPAVLSSFVVDGEERPAPGQIVPDPSQLAGYVVDDGGIATRLTAVLLEVQALRADIHTLQTYLTRPRWYTRLWAFLWR